LLHAVDYAPKGAAQILSRNGTGEITRLELPPLGLTDESREKARKARTEFLGRLQEGDIVLLEMGAAGDKFGLAATRRGANVLRVPTFHMKAFRAAESIEDVAEGLVTYFDRNPGEFYPFTEREEVIVRLRVHTRARLMVQRKIRIPAQLRLQAVYRDLYLLDPEGSEEAFVDARIKADPIFKTIADKEKELENKIKPILRKTPVYKAVFEPIKGIGPVIAGAIIAEIGDIRRFRTPGALKAYCGYHNLPDGSVPRRRKGEVSARNDYLRQAVWLFTSRLDLLRDDAEWKQRFLARLAFERSRAPELTKGHTRARARRYIGQQFLIHIWTAWREFEGLPVQ
jgi:transposase